MVFGILPAIIGLKLIKESTDLVKDSTKPRPKRRAASNLQSNDRRINDLSNNILKNFSTFKGRK